MRRPARRSGPRAPAPRRGRGAVSGPSIVRMRRAARRAAVAPTIARILAAVAPAGLDADRLTDLAVALAEALSNAAVHGHRLDPRRRVAVALAVSPGCVV